MVDKSAGRTVTDAEWAAHQAHQSTGLTWAVVTTGIHCRDGCPARPNRENLRTFSGAASAEAAGYRACKRCGGGAGGA